MELKTEFPNNQGAVDTPFHIGTRRDVCFPNKLVEWLMNAAYLSANSRK